MHVSVPLLTIVLATPIGIWALICSLRDPEPVPPQITAPFRGLLERCEVDTIWCGQDDLTDSLAVRAQRLGLVRMSPLGTGAEFWDITRLGVVSLKALKSQ